MDTMGVMPIPPATSSVAGASQASGKWFCGELTSMLSPTANCHMARDPPWPSIRHFTAMR